MIPLTELESARAELGYQQHRNEVLQTEVAALRARVAELAMALRETLRYIEDEAKALDATCDNWPIVKQARAALAQPPSPSGEDRGEAGE